MAKLVEVRGRVEAYTRDEREYTFPAPVKGLNRRDSAAAMEVEHALRMVNFYPEDGYVRTRKGSVAHAAFAPDDEFIADIEPPHRLGPLPELVFAAGERIYRPQALPSVFDDQSPPVRFRAASPWPDWLVLSGHGVLTGEAPQFAANTQVALEFTAEDAFGNSVRVTDLDATVRAALPKLPAPTALAATRPAGASGSALVELAFRPGTGTPVDAVFVAEARGLDGVWGAAGRGAASPLRLPLAGSGYRLRLRAERPGRGLLVPARIPSDWAETDGPELGVREPSAGSGAQLAVPLGTQARRVHPVSPHAAAPTSRTVEWRWGAVADADAYEVFRKFPDPTTYYFSSLLAHSDPGGSATRRLWQTTSLTGFRTIGRPERLTVPSSLVRSGTTMVGFILDYRAGRNIEVRLLRTETEGFTEAALANLRLSFLIGARRVDLNPVSNRLGLTRGSAPIDPKVTSAQYRWYPGPQSVNDALRALVLPIPTLLNIGLAFTPAEQILQRTAGLAFRWDRETGDAAGTGVKVRAVASDRATGGFGLLVPAPERQLGAPDSLSGVRLPNRTGSVMSLSWASAAGAPEGAGYEVQKRVGGAAVWTPVSHLEQVSAETAMAGDGWEARVRATKAGYRSSAWVALRCPDPEEIPVGHPAFDLLRDDGAQKDTATLSFGVQKGVTAYRYQLRQDGGEWGAAVQVAVAPGDGEKRVTLSVPGSGWDFRWAVPLVRDGYSAPTAGGAYAVVDQLPLRPPGLPRADRPDATADAVRVSWIEVPFAEGYRLRHRADRGVGAWTEEAVSGPPVSLDLGDAGQLQVRTEPAAGYLASGWAEAVIAAKREAEPPPPPDPGPDDPDPLPAGGHPVTVLNAARSPGPTDATVLVTWVLPVGQVVTALKIEFYTNGRWNEDSAAGLTGSSTRYSKELPGSATTSVRVTTTVAGVEASARYEVPAQQVDEPSVDGRVTGLSASRHRTETHHPEADVAWTLPVLPAGKSVSALRIESRKGSTGMVGQESLSTTATSKELSVPGSGWRVRVVTTVDGREFPSEWATVAAQTALGAWTAFPTIQVGSVGGSLRRVSGNSKMVEGYLYRSGNQPDEYGKVRLSDSGAGAAKKVVDLTVNPPAAGRRESARVLLKGRPGERVTVTDLPGDDWVANTRSADVILPARPDTVLSKNGLVTRRGSGAMFTSAVHIGFQSITRQFQVKGIPIADITSRSASSLWEVQRRLRTIAASGAWSQNWTNWVTLGIHSTPVQIQGGNNEWAWTVTLNGTGSISVAANVDRTQFFGTSQYRIRLKPYSETGNDLGADYQTESDWLDLD